MQERMIMMKERNERDPRPQGGRSGGNGGKKKKKSFIFICRKLGFRFSSPEKKKKKKKRKEKVVESFLPSHVVASPSSNLLLF